MKAPSRQHQAAPNATETRLSTPVPNLGPRRLILAIYCVSLLTSGAYLFKLARWAASSGYEWLGPSVLAVFVGAAVILVIVQLFRALQRKRYLHLLFLVLIVLSFFPAYFNLGRPLERFHLLEFSLLGALVFWTLAPRRYTLQFYLLAVNILIVVSFVDELLQGFVPDRIYDLNDIWVNVFSGTIGILVFRMADLNAPLPLHPHYREEHISSREHPPLIDLHVYKSDFLYFVPVILIVSADFLLTHAVTSAEIIGTWQSTPQAGITLDLRRDGSAMVDFPNCSQACEVYSMDGNLLDGYRLYFKCGEDDRELPPECQEVLRGIHVVRDRKTGDVFLEGDSLARLTRAAEDP